MAALIDELIVTNIKIYHLAEKIEKNKHAPEDTKKLKDLNQYRSELCQALNRSITMKKSIATLIDELTVTNLKIFHLVDKIQKNKHTREDARKAQELNVYRSKLCNNLNKEFKQKENNIRV